MVMVVIKLMRVFGVIMMLMTSVTCVTIHSMFVMLEGTTMLFAIFVNVISVVMIFKRVRFMNMLPTIISKQQNNTIIR